MRLDGDLHFSPPESGVMSLGLGGRNPLVNQTLVSACLCTGFSSAERVRQEEVGQGEVGGVTCKVLCTWQLLGLAVKSPWLGPGGPILTLAT